MHLITLGNLRLYLNSAERSNLSPRATLLLAVLACERRRPVSKTRIIDLLWGAEPTSSTRHSLAQLGYEIRGRIGHAIVSTRVAVQLDPSFPISCDFDIIASSHLDVETLRKYCFAGGFLDEVTLSHNSFEEWRADKSMSVRRRLLSLSKNYLAVAISHKDWRSVRSLSEAMLNLDPFSEEGWEGQIAANVAEGNVLDATIALEEVARLYWQELGVGLPENIALLKRRLGSAGVSQLTTAKPAVAKVLPFRGRIAETAGIRARWHSLMNEGCSELGIICGPPGFGKTRLINRIQREVALDGGRSVYIRCDETYRTTAYALAYSILQAAAKRESNDVELSALFRPRSDLIETPSISPVAVSHLMADRLSEGLGDRCTVIAIDDLQWADNVSLMSVRHVLHALSDRPYLWLLSSRPEGCALATELNTVWSRFAGRQGLVTTLSPLTDEEIAGIYTDWAAQMDLVTPNSSLVQSACRFARGNPALLSIWVSCVASDAGAPSAVATELGSCLAIAGERELALLRTLTVLGGACSAQTLQSVCGLGRVELAAALDTMVHAGVIARGEVLVEFSHDIVRLYMEQQMTHAEYESIGMRALQVAEDSRTTSAIRRAQQALLAGSTSDAIKHTLAAAEQCARAGAFEEAEYFLKAAVERANDGSQRRVALEALGEFLLDRERLVEARVCFGEAGALDNGESELHTATVEYMRLREDLRTLSRPAGELALIAGSLIEKLKTTGRKELLAQALGASVNACHDAGNAGAVRDTLEVIRGTWRSFEHVKDRVLMLGLAARISALYASSSEAVQWGSLALGEAESTDDGLVLVHALMGCGTSLLARGDIRDAVGHFGRAFEATRSPKAFHYRVRVLNNYGVALLEHGELKEARAVFTEGASSATGHDLLYFYGNLSLVAVYEKSWNEAERWISALGALNGTFGASWADAFGDSIAFAICAGREQLCDSRIIDRLVSLSSTVNPGTGLHHLVLRAAAQVLATRSPTDALQWIERGLAETSGRHALLRARMLLLHSALSRDSTRSATVARQVARWADRHGAHLIAGEASSLSMEVSTFPEMQ